MRFRRRKRIGASLLIAGAGVSLGIGCSEEKPTGNTMAPPQIDVCIEVEPTTARVLVDGKETADGACTKVYKGSKVTIQATAEGYQRYDAEIEKIQKDDSHKIKLIEASEQTKENIEKYGTITPEGRN